MYLYTYSPKFDFRPKGICRPKSSIYEEQARLPLGLLPDLETNAHLYVQDTGKVQLCISPAHAPPKPPLDYIASLYSHTLCICKPPMSSTNHRVLRACAKHMLIIKKQHINPSTPSTSSKCKVCILYGYVQHMLIICAVQADPSG